MVALTKAELLGFVELRVGSLAVQVPIRSGGPEATDGNAPAPLARFAMEGNAFAILVRGEPSNEAVEAAVREAAGDAVKELSKKLLN